MVQDHAAAFQCLSSRPVNFRERSDRVIPRMPLANATTIDRYQSAGVRLSSAMYYEIGSGSCEPPIPSLLLWCCSTVSHAPAVVTGSRCDEAPVGADRRSRRSHALCPRSMCTPHDPELTRMIQSLRVMVQPRENRSKSRIAVCFSPHAQQQPVGSNQTHGQPGLEVIQTGQRCYRLQTHGKRKPIFGSVTVSSRSDSSTRPTPARLEIPETVTATFGSNVKTAIARQYAISNTPC
jgi:hypothetical protein